ncbi:helitron_like_N domain-containing protein [Trichonephila clavipes]|nr:helitron_like_N domain-containing protein [Trichonephila clavipes]
MIRSSAVPRQVYRSDLQCDRRASALEVLLSRQHTMLWNEEHCLDIAPVQHSTPLNIIYDVYAEELSFPLIYYQRSNVTENSFPSRQRVRSLSTNPKETRSTKLCPNMINRSKTS